MRNKFAFTAVLLVMSILLAGCYTQLGYHAASRITPRGADQIDETKTLNEHEEDGEDQASVEPQTETVEDGGYYGHRKRTYDRHIPYYDRHYFSDPYPYYGYYSPYYPYYPYYRDYGYWNPYRYGQRHHRYYAPRYYTNRDFHHGKRRSRSHRGADSQRSFSDRPSQKMDNESNRTSPKRDSSEPRKLRRYQRRH